MLVIGVSTLTGPGLWNQIWIGIPVHSVYKPVVSPSCSICKIGIRCWPVPGDVEVS